MIILFALSALVLICISCLYAVISSFDGVPTLK